MDPYLHPWGHPNQRVAAVIAVLQDWFEALENDTVASRFPSFNHKRRDGKPQWTDEEVERIIETIERNIENEVFSRPTYWRNKGYDKSCGFDRLELMQKRALVQQLDDAMRKSDGMVSVDS